PDRPFTPYDPEAAMQLLAESDYAGETIPYQLQAGYYTNGEQVAQAMVQTWQEIGINAEVQIGEDSVTGPDRVAHTWSNSSRLADPDGSLWVLWGAGSNVQEQYWDAPEEFNRLGEEARSTLDEQVRYENYQRMLDIWEEEAPGTVLYDPVEFYGVSSAVNWSPYSFYYMDFRPYNLSFNE
ncbi:MAG TPA: ABC transporter substrate-binding protein, partial [Thermomicrobiales bacterium]|nr:ABC transporter substrate-binding protein [Thermomicrobiales bacterium]